MTLDLLAGAALLVAAAVFAAVAGWRRRDLVDGRAVLALVAVASVLVPWLVLPAGRVTAFTSHEDALWQRFIADEAPMGQDRYGLNPLLAALYAALGAALPRTLPAYQVVATALGAGLPVLAAATARVLGAPLLAVAVVGGALAIEPTSVFWRIQGFHVALPTSLWAGCLLLAALHARRPGRDSVVAWVLLGAAACYFRPELGGPVLCTAVLPLGAQGRRALAAPEAWVPAVLFGLLALAPGLAVLARGDLTQGESAVTFEALRTNLSVPALWWPLISVPAVAALLAVFGGGAARRLATMALLAPLPAALFSDFGPRHLLPAVAGLGVAAAVAAARRPLALVGTAAAALFAVEAAPRILAMGAAYGLEVQRYPGFPGVPIPEGPPPAGWERCALYSDAFELCEGSPHCMPVKDLRNALLVRARWAEYAGCVVLTVAASDGAVAGTRHERWAALLALYDVDGLGVLEQPHGPPLHLYRLRRAP